MKLPDKFKYASFKSRTDYTWRRRGSNMEQVDTALKLYWTATTRNDQSGELSTLLRVVKECNGWMKKKKDKNTATAGTFKTRWDEINELGQAAFAVASVLRSQLAGTMGAPQSAEMRAQLAYEQNRQRHLGARTTGGAAVGTTTKALDGSYAAERNMYAAQPKTRGVARANPVSMSTVHEMHEMFDENKMAYDPAFANKYGGIGAVTKSSRDLSVRDMQQIDRVMVDAAETGTSAPFLRHVLYLDKSSRLPYMALVSAGRLFKSDGTTSWNVVNSAYAMDEYGNLFIDDGGLADKGGKGVRMNHTTFLAGKNVICAGTLTVTDGRLVRLTTNSGHYKPSGVNLYHCLEELRIAGVTITATTIDLKLGENEGHETDVLNIVHYRGVLPNTLTSYYTKATLERGGQPHADTIPPGRARPRASATAGIGGRTAPGRTG